MNLQYSLLGAAAFVAVAAVPAAAIVTTAPAGFENTDAPAISDGPFVSTGTGGRRYQQIYDASLFSNFTGPGLITGIQFRAANPENQFRPNSVSASDVIITLSTTNVLSSPGATAAGNFSASFADNVGSDVQTVYTGQLTLDRGGSNATGPQPFAYGFELQFPFKYDPTLGNLLLDVIVPMSATVTQGAGFGRFESFDASTASGDGTASVRGTGGSSVGAANQTGLITQFTSEAIPVAAVPEPASLALLGLGGLALAGRRRAMKS